MISPVQFGAIYPVTSKDPQKLDSVVHQIKKESTGPIETVEMFAVPQLLETKQGLQTMSVKLMLPQPDAKLPPSAQKVQLIVTEQDVEEHRKMYPLLQAWKNGAAAYQKNLEKTLETMKDALQDKAEAFWQSVVSRGTPATQKEMEQQVKEEQTLLEKIEETANTAQAPVIPKSGQEYIKKLVDAVSQFSRQNQSFGLDAKVVEEGLDQGIFDINSGKENI